MLKNLTDVCVGTIGWWASGWAFAYGGPMKDDLLENGFMGFSLQPFRWELAGKIDSMIP